MNGQTHWNCAEVGVACHPECAITQQRQWEKIFSFSQRYGVRPRFHEPTIATEQQADGTLPMSPVPQEWKR
jgi:hypothetical protein